MIGGLFLLTGVLSLHAAHVASEAPLCIFPDAEFLHSYKGSDPSHAMNLAKLQLIFTIVVFPFSAPLPTRGGGRDCQMIEISQAGASVNEVLAAPWP